MDLKNFTKHLIYQSANTQIPDNFRSEEHTSELQSHSDLVCRLLLEKKKKKKRSKKKKKKKEKEPSSCIKES